jgi:hypothetical protein
MWLTIKKKQDILKEIRAFSNALGVAADKIGEGYHEMSILQQ